MDAQGAFVRAGADGRLHACDPEDNVLQRNGTTWCNYSFPVSARRGFTLEGGRQVVGARLYLSVDRPLLLRVDPATGGLVQPDPGNPGDPNTDTVFDWIEFAVDGSGFHGNTTCVDMFGLPLTLETVDRSGATAGPVGITARRSDLFKAFQDTLPRAFVSLVDPAHRRIISPSHASQPDLQHWLDPYIKRAWARYRHEDLVLTPDEGTFTGRVQADGQLVFTRPGDPTRYRIPSMPTTLEAFRCDGPLSYGNGLERVIGAQLGAMLNRHLLDEPDRSHEITHFYGGEPANSYARFWHTHSLGGKAYGFAYDDVNDQSTLVYAAAPREVRIGYRLD